MKCPEARAGFVGFTGWAAGATGSASTDAARAAGTGSGAVLASVRGRLPFGGPSVGGSPLSDLSNSISRALLGGLSSEGSRPSEPEAAASASESEAVAVSTSASESAPGFASSSR